MKTDPSRPAFALLLRNNGWMSLCFLLYYIRTRTLTECVCVCIYTVYARFHWIDPTCTCMYGVNVMCKLFKLNSQSEKCLLILFLGETNLLTAEKIDFGLSSIPYSDFEAISSTT